MNGVLPVEKPPGPTSHDVVAVARRALRNRRIGHTGTLDPFASGLLLLCIGQATRIAEYLTGLDKTYLATVRLGITTDTDDLTGQTIAEHSAAQVDRAAAEEALARMRGHVLQRPPAYSAKKVAGERAYVAARAGRRMELEPAAVRIDELSILRFDPPELDLHVACGSGTYIRAIARDLGEALGTGAHLTALRRTHVGTFDVADAVPLDQLADGTRVDRALVTPAVALRHLTGLELTDQQAADVRHGRIVPVTSPAGDLPGTAAATAGGALVAVGQLADGLFKPRKVFQ